MATGVKTEKVRTALIGAAGTALTEAAGAPHANGARVISKAEQERLPADLQRAVDYARKDKRIVTVDDAVASYARHVGQVLGAVDKKGKGTLSEKEAKALTDPALRSRVLDVRTRLMAQSGGATTGGTTTGGAATTAGPVHAAALRDAVADLSDTWGSENIMDGIVSVAQSTAAGDAAAVAARDLAALLDDGTVDAFVGAATVSAAAPLTTAAMKQLAVAVNDDGFQYAQQDEVARIQGELAAVVKELGGPAGLQFAVARQQAQPSHLDLDGGALPAQVWSIVNPQTRDALSITVVKGTL